MVAIDTAQVERHLRMLALAKDCAALGARIRTVGYVSGMPHAQLTELFFTERSAAARGRPPDSPDWYHSANLLDRTEASIFVSIYRRIRELGFGPAEALVTAYKHYLAVCHDKPRVHFDRAFDLASHMDGIWLVRDASFSLVECPICASQYVTAIGSHARTNRECPFCKLVKRYRIDPRIQSSFRATPLPDPTELYFGVLAMTIQMRRG